MSKYFDALNRLEEFRITNERASNEILGLGHFLLDDGRYHSSLKDEIWVIYEQVFIAALDCNEIDYAKSLLLKIGVKFPNSLRFRRLAGMSLEAQGEFQQALEIYSKILEEDESHLSTLKRKIAVLKGQGLYTETIIELNKFLDISPLDKESWIELSNLYLNESLIEQAAHCLEELILIEPNNHIYHLKYAEIIYTIGNIELSLKEFCRVVELCPNHIRGFYGINLCTSRLLAKDSKEKELYKDLNALSAKQLLEGYSKKTASDTSKRLLEKYLKKAI